MDTELIEDEVVLGPLTIVDIKDVANDPFNIDADKVKVFKRSPALRKREDRAGTKTIRPDGKFIAYDLLDCAKPPYSLDALAKLMTQNEPHLAAVGAKVVNIVGLGYDIIDSHALRQQIDKYADKPKRQESIRQKAAALRSEVFKWLEGLNDEELLEETLTKVWTDYESMGNGYLEIGRTKNGLIEYVGHIPAVTMRVRNARDGYVQVSGDKAVFFRRYGDKKRSQNYNPLSSDSTNEVIHFKNYSPVSNYYGVPNIVSAMQAVAGMKYSSAYNLEYFEHKAAPRYVIIVKGGKLSKESQASVLSFFEASLKGKHHRSLYIPLPGDSDLSKSSFEMKPIEAGAQDASFMNYHKINVESVLMAAGVPATKVGTTANVGLAVAREADKTFKEQTCRPKQRVIDQYMTQILSERTDLFRFKLNELTLTDEDTQSKIDERYLRLKTIVPNEVRARWGWSGIKDGDKPVDLNAEKKAQALASRQRDQERSANATDSNGEGRNTQGDGRTND